MTAQVASFPIFIAPPSIDDASSCDSLFEDMIFDLREVSLSLLCTLPFKVILFETALHTHIDHETKRKAIDSKINIVKKVQKRLKKKDKTIKSLKRQRSRDKM